MAMILTASFSIWVELKFAHTQSRHKCGGFLLVIQTIILNTQRLPQDLMYLLLHFQEGKFDAILF